MKTHALSLAPVVVVVDRGGSYAAVHFGAAEALRTGRPMHLVHVAPAGDGWLRMVGQDSLRIALTRADVEVAGRVGVRSTLLRGSALVELSRLAASAALVVVGQPPPRANRRPALSTAAALAAAVDVPVVVVPAEWVERCRGVVTVGFDPAAADNTALTAAMSLARLRGAVLRVIVAGPCERSEVESRLERLGGDACDLAIELDPGPVVPALSRAAVTSDVLVLGRHRPAESIGSRVGVVGREVLDAPACPVLLTPPGHSHPASGTAGDATHEEEHHMYARAGDRIVIRSTHFAGPVRDGEIVEVEHEDGRPPYRVRWSDTGHESLFFPGPGAHIDHEGPSYEPEYDVPAAAG
jgi:hypothetical protein